MQRTTAWILMAGTAALGLLGVLAHARMESPQVAVLGVARTVLQGEVGMNPHDPRQLAQLDRHLVPGSQALFLTQWLWGQAVAGDTASGLSPVSTHVAIADRSVDFPSATRAVVDYRIAVTRAFRPRGSQRTQEIVTFWLEHSEQQWKVYGESFNFDPVDFPGRPVSPGYDVTHLNPAPPAPQGA